MEKELKVTSIEELKKLSCGELVELPGFTSDTKFIARLKRPSMLSMVKAGKIPNSLLIQANQLFSGGVPQVAKKNMEDEEMMDNLFDILDLICRESFIEPTYNELQDNGIELTDEQQMAIFTYTQNGVRSLESFRSE